MLMKTALMGLVGLAVLAEASVVSFIPASGHRLVARQNNGKGKGGQGKNNNNNQGNNNNNNNNNNGGNNGANCLNPAVIQSASASTGQNGGQAEKGQVNSKTDANNFINFCLGKTITNGQQNKGGSCNGVVMGEIPASNRMVSTVILNPKNGDDLPPRQTFNIQVKIANMQLGSFTNAQATYYSAPQELQNGQIVGHTHVTVQDLGATLNPTTPLDASKFAFFKGINDPADGQGQLQAAVTNGLPPGNYRLCTMAGASNHQPVLMPVAQRGAQDDCVRFTVGGGPGGNKGGNNGGNNGGNQGGNGGNQGANQGNQGGNGGNQGANQGNQGGNGGNQGANNGGNRGNGNNQANQGGNNPAGNNANNANNQGANKGNQGGQASGGGGGQNIGGAAPPVENSGDATRPFKVKNDTFVNRAAAVQRACDIQNNACSDAVNRGQAPGKTLQDCAAQVTACRAANGN